jgi:hypothetical protein
MSETYDFGRQLREFLAGLLGLDAGRRPPVGGGGTPGGSRPAAAMESFPPAGIDRVKHDLRIALLEVDENGAERELEDLFFEGHMTLERGEPYTGKDGLRRIDFVVTSWVATAWSAVLEQEILYLLSEDEEKQPVSTITAMQRGADFPATFEFNVIFDARANNRVVHRRHHGRPAGDRFFVVPPTGDRATSPTFTRFEDAVIRLEHPQRGTTLIFRPKDCNDRASETVRTFAVAASAR